MEGFGVALACALARTRLVVVRGFSNRVGERDSRSWRIPLALAAARELVLGCLEAAP
jgi:nucleoside phosphorylase